MVGPGRRSQNVGKLLQSQAELFSHKLEIILYHIWGKRRLPKTGRSFFTGDLPTADQVGKV